jgi:nucleolar pre-ribosomal-associated protein 2
LDLALCDSHPEVHRDVRIQANATPKEEWVLRWLLKRLRSGKNYRLDAASFLLLRQLIDLISPKNLAAVLKDQKFLSILCETFADLETDIFAALENGLTTLGSDSESSHTLAGSPPRDDRRGNQGKKRKRMTTETDADPMEVDEHRQSPAACFLAFIRALDCLHGFMSLSQRTLGTDGVANSHLKLALRGEPEAVAMLLGRSFRVAAVAAKQFSHAGQTTDLQHLLYVFPSAVELWELRSYRHDDGDNKSSNEFFARHCFAHALRLQICLRSAKLDTDERAHLLHAIERIIALHVLLPARAAFFERGGSGIDYSKDEPDWSSVKPVTDTFRPIIREFAVAKENQPSKEGHVQPWRSVELLPELFDNAVRAVPRDVFRRQTHEAPWLETLFVAVAELSFSTAKEEDFATFSTKFISVLEQLLQVALDRNVGLSLHTILAHANYTGLFEEGLEKVQWKVTALFIGLGVDIFLPNSGLPDSRNLLDALLDKVLLHWRENGSRSTNSPNVIKDKIVLPLMRGFAAARDLPNFLEIWHNQLATVEESRQHNSNLGLFSVWEDDDLSDAYSDLMRTSLTESHVAAQMRTAAEETRGDNGRVAETPQSYAKFVIAEASFRGRVAPFSESEQTLSHLLETLTSTLNSKQAFHWRWRLWRLLRNFLSNTLQSAETKLAHAIMELVAVAEKTVHRNHKDLSKRQLASLESWEAYRFSIVAIKAHASETQLSSFVKITKDVTNLITSISTKDAKNSMKTPWNGRTDSVESQTNLGLAYFLALVRVPEVWALIGSDDRSRLFRHILSLAAAQYHSSSLPLEAVAEEARFLQAWASVVCHEYMLNAPFIVADLSLLLNESIEQDSSNRRLLIESLQRVPAPLITRGLRTNILNRLQKVLLQQENSPEVLVGIITMMAKLTIMPKCDATLTSDWEPIWTVARAVTLEGTDTDLLIMKSFRSLYRAILAKLLALTDDDRKKLFKKLFSRVSKQTTKMREVDRNSMACFLLRLTLSELWVHRKQLQTAFSEKDLAECRQKVFDLVLADMKYVKDQCRKGKLEETITLIKTIDALEDFEDLATNNIEVEKFLSKIENYMEMSIDSGPSRLIRRRLLASKGPEKNIAQPVLQCAETLSLQSLYAEDQQLFIRATTERFRSMPVERITQAICEVRGLGLIGQNAGYRLLVIYLAVASLSPVEDKESATAREISLLCTALAEAIPQSTSIDQFCFASECLDLLLRSHTRCLSQCNIDAILAAIASASSKIGPQISSTYAPTIYTRLCRLMGVVLSLQRLKIGGRFHLVVNAMQRLLGCLFARSRKRGRSARSQTTLSQPFWLAPLDASHATYYTRLLTSLCDPTVSAVLRPQPGASRDALTDQTKKAKRIAGQYLQYVVMEYAQCSLRGSLSPDVKAAIMPGLYAALDVMSRESMRALNAALDVSGRAVFKSLYDDYVKFGKWNKA